MITYLRHRLVCDVFVFGGVVMRIELTDSLDYPGLRDYFLRLGASVTSGDGVTLEVDFPAGLLDEDETPEMYYETWARTTASTLEWWTAAP